MIALSTNITLPYHPYHSIFYIVYAFFALELKSNYEPPSINMDSNSESDFEDTFFDLESSSNYGTNLRTFSSLFIIEAKYPVVS
jgi:hypothetical protein